MINTEFKRKRLYTATTSATATDTVSGSVSKKYTRTLNEGLERLRTLVCFNDAIYVEE